MNKGQLKTNYETKAFGLPVYFVFPICYIEHDGKPRKNQIGQCGTKIVWDKYLQNFDHFVRRNKSYIAHIRQEGNIDLEYVKKNIQECYSFLEKGGSIHSAEFLEKWSTLEQYANGKIKADDIKILLKLNIPPNWEQALIWHILTGEIKLIYGPSNRCYIKEVDKKRGEIIIAVSPDATFRDMKRLWESHAINDNEHFEGMNKQLSVIEELQKDLSGNWLKDRHIIDEKKLREQRSIAKDHEKYIKKKRKPVSEYDYHTGKKNI